MTGARLTRQARDTIKWTGRITIAGYIRHYYGGDAWGGDECGCVDDRCIGYHHDASDECQCLAVWINEAIVEQARDRVLADLALIRRRGRTYAYPSGLGTFKHDDLVLLRDAFAAAVDEDEQMRRRLA